MIAHNCHEGCDHRRAQELERMWRNRLIYTVLVVQPLRKEDNMEIPAELKTELMCNHQHHCWVFIQKSWDQDHKAMPTFSIDHLSASQTVARPHIHRCKSMIEKIRRHLAGWPFLWHKAGLGSARVCDHWNYSAGGNQHLRKNDAHISTNYFSHLVCSMLMNIKVFHNPDFHNLNYESPNISIHIHWKIPSHDWISSIFLMVEARDLESGE